MHYFVVAVAVRMLNSFGTFFQRSQNVYVLQQLNHSKGILFPHKFVHVLLVQGLYSCDCKLGLQSSECAHIRIVRDNMLNFGDRSAFPSHAPESSVMSSGGERRYVSMNLPVVPVLCFATGNIRAICSVCATNRYSFVHLRSDGLYTCRVHNTKGCEHVHMMKQWLLPGDTDLAEVKTNTNSNIYIVK